MTPKQKKLARHALGLPNAAKRSYRNRYFTAVNHPEWEAMVEAGEASGAEGGRGKQIMYWLTRKGASLALLQGETLDVEDFAASA